MYRFFLFRHSLSLFVFFHLSRVQEACFLYIPADRSCRAPEKNDLSLSPHAACKIGVAVSFERRLSWPIGDTGRYPRRSYIFRRLP